ncbi:MAG: ATP-grasp domain-containing protein [Acidobacteria bacterium]|nr:ATP-grasp domain-containing protein [Acidobacteriota bacterium]
MTTRTVLLFGGLSRERMVSVATAQTLGTLIDDPACWFWRPDGTVAEIELDALLDHQKPFQSPFEPAGREVGGRLAEAFDELRESGAVVVVGLHGGEGENGTVAAWLEERRIPFTGSGSVSSRLAFDKVAAKAAVAEKGLNVAEAEILGGQDDDSLERLIDLVDRSEKVVVKPVEEGSSYGMEILVSTDDANRFVEKIRGGEYERYLAERFLRGTELTGGVIEHRGEVIALPTVEIRPEEGRSFDYRGKYLGEGIREICPAEVSEEVEQATRQAAKIAHKTLGCFGYSRSDFIVEDGEPYYLETNTLPGLTKSSLLPQELREAGISMREFLDSQVELSRGRYRG